MDTSCGSVSSPALRNTRDPFFIQETPQDTQHDQNAARQARQDQASNGCAPGQANPWCSRRPCRHGHRSLLRGSAAVDGTRQEPCPPPHSPMSALWNVGGPVPDPRKASRDSRILANELVLFTCSTSIAIRMPRNTRASTAMKTTLSLSSAATPATGPSCRARL